MTGSSDQLRFLLSRIRERLWVKPLAVCLLSIAAALVAGFADGVVPARVVPDITAESVETLLSIMAASMLVIATFSVASMLSAYASAGSAATPRSFTLVIRDDVSQNALSTFIGAFIFSIVALTAVKNSYFGTTGRFVLFVETATVFGIVILTFVRWVDRVARLGRLATTIQKVEEATADALRRRRDAPTLCGIPLSGGTAAGRPVFAATVGYVQHIDVAALQAWAEEVGGRVTVAALPGTFVAPDRPIGYLAPGPGAPAAGDHARVVKAFTVGDDRRFDDDPRFGLVVLSEIAGRALSPAVNDPGTAIAILGSLVRLFVLWSEPATPPDAGTVHYDRVAVPALSVKDMFDDAFTACARDGAGVVEVAIRLQKALRSLASVGDAAMREVALRHRRLALERARAALELTEDLAAVQDAAAFTASDVQSLG